MSFKVVMTARVLPYQDTQAYEANLGVTFESVPCNTQDEIIAACHAGDAIITLMQPYSRRVIERLEKCKLIFHAGTGFDTIDVQAATEHGICIAYPGDYCQKEVAEHALALILACARKIARLDRAVRQGKWGSFEKREIRGKILPQIFRLEGQTLGLVGLGRIGKTIAHKAKGLGLNVIAFDPYLLPDIFEQAGVQSVTFDQLLERSDFVSIQANFSPEAKHMFGISQFRKMKKTAYIINVGRGGFINQTDLLDALSSGYIAGAGLDVVEEEPNGIGPNHPLLQLDNVIITAHSAYYSEESSAKYKQSIYEAVASIVHGEWPEWLVNPEVKDNFKKRWGNGLVK